MIRVHLFGSIDLRSGTGDEIRSVLAQPKRTAVLACLAAAAPGSFTRRGTLLALLWPDLDEAHARNALSKSIHHLRRSLGDQAIVSRGNDELGLSADHVWCDVTAFESALASDPEAALDLYARGPLMDGFVLAQLPDLEHWLDGRRAQLQHRAREAAGTLLARVIDSGDSVRAAEIARRLVALFPHDETLLRDLLTVLDQSGDRAGAVQAYQDFASRLARDLELEPSPEADALVRAIRARVVVIDAWESADESRDGNPRDEPEAAPSRVVESVVDVSPATSGSGPGGHLFPIALLSLLLLGAAGVATARMLGSSDRDANVDPDLVAVLPFRVSGAEPSHGYLREGMLDLLSARLAGETTPRAVDPRTVFRTWREVAGNDDSDLSAEQSLALARRMGVGRVVLGEVVSLPGGRLALSASLHDVRSGEADRPITVEGPSDSLLSLVDRLAAGLLTLQAGQGKRLSTLMTHSLPALRLYLEGQSAYRTGHPDVAQSRFARAAEIDTTFATAALWWQRSKIRWDGPERPDLVALLRRHRDRLSDRDRAFYDLGLVMMPGSDSNREQVRAHQELVKRYSDDPDTWYLWALLHPNRGLFLGIPDTIAIRRGVDGLEHVLSLDSTYFAALEPLARFSFQLGDTARGRRYSEQYLARASTGPEAETVRCVLDASTRDLAALPALLARLDSVGAYVARSCLFGLHAMPTASAARDAAADHLGRRFLADPGIPSLDGMMLAAALHMVAADRGRPAEAERYLKAMRAAGMGDTLLYLASHIDRALYWEGDGEAAERAAMAIAEQLGRQSAEQLAGLSPADSVPLRDGLWALGQWRLVRGDTASVRPIIRQLRELGGEGQIREDPRVLVAAEALETWHAAQAGSPDADARITRLDSLVRSVPTRFPFVPQVHLILASLLERRGDYRDALRVLSGFRIGFAWSHASTVLRERGRLALLAGDTAGALSAYQRYLAMRADPEPAVLPEVARIRAEVARLTTSRSELTR